MNELSSNAVLDQKMAAMRIKNLELLKRHQVCTCARSLISSPKKARNNEHRRLIFLFLSSSRVKGLFFSSNMFCILSPPRMSLQEMLARFLTMLLAFCSNSNREHARMYRNEGRDRVSTTVLNVRNRLSTIVIAGLE